MLELNLYKDNKNEFLNNAKDLSHADKELFLKAININEIGDYKALIIFLSDLVSINFFHYETHNRCDFQLECPHPLDKGGYNSLFLENALDVLAIEYKENPNEYKSYLNSFEAKENVKIYDPWLYVLANFLPGFIESRTEEDLFNYFGIKFLISSIESYKGNPGKYSAELIKLNPAFARYAANKKYHYKLNNQDREKNIKALAEADSIPDKLKLSYKLELLKQKIGEHVLPNQSSLYVNTKYSIIKHKDSTKKALVIYGYDHNGAFKGDSTELNLFLNGFDVLLIDARDTIVSKKDISSVIKESGYSDLSEIYINMHGSNAYVVTDTLFTLNSHLSSEHSIVSASSLFKNIVSELNGQPIKVMINSCHSQLFSHNALNILPNGSEILMQSEDQEINGYRYSFDAYESLYKGINELLGIEDYRIISAKAAYYINNNKAPDFNFKIPSSTYIKLGKCNFRTAVNFSQKDLNELLSKVSKEEVSEKVSIYLNNSIDQSITDDVYNFFNILESTADEYPLLNYREYNSSNSSFPKYLGIASAIYGIYDQCGNGYIADSDFIRNNDSFFGKMVLDMVLNAPPLISNALLFAAGKVIDFMSQDEPLL